MGLLKCVESFIKNITLKECKNTKSILERIEKLSDQEKYDLVKDEVEYPITMADMFNAGYTQKKDDLYYKDIDGCRVFIKEVIDDKVRDGFIVKDNWPRMFVELDVNGERRFYQYNLYPFYTFPVRKKKEEIKSCEKELVDIFLKNDDRFK